MPDNRNTDTITITASVLSQEPNDLHRLLARAAWITDPSVTVRHDAEAGVTTVLVLRSAPTTGEAVIDPAVYIGLDDPSATGWPTIITLLTGSDPAEHPGVAARDRIHDLIGDRAWNLVVELQAGHASRYEELFLSEGEAAALQATWARLLSNAKDSAHEFVIDDDELAAQVKQWTAAYPCETVALSAVREVQVTEALPGTVHRTPAIAVTDNALFEQLIGRPKKLGEPWPTARVTFARDGANATCTISLTVPELASIAPRVVATVSVEGRDWTVLLEREPAQDQPWRRILLGYRTIPVNTPTPGHQLESIHLRLGTIPGPAHQ